MPSVKKKVTRKVKKIQAKKPAIEISKVKTKTPKAAPKKVKKVSDTAEAKKEETHETTPSSKKIKTKANRLKEMEEADEEAEPRGVIYVGHVPDGFFEPEMKTYFSQFGDVTRLRLSRSRKTGGSKGYAFVEFKEASVAEVVAQTMHKYLLFGKQLVCNVVPREKCHPQLFKNWKWIPKDTRKERFEKEMHLINDRPTIEVNGKSLPQMTQVQVKSRNESRKKLSNRLDELGIDYDLEGIDEPDADEGKAEASEKVSSENSKVKKKASKKAKAAKS